MRAVTVTTQLLPAYATAAGCLSGCLIICPVRQCSLAVSRPSKMQQWFKAENETTAHAASQTRLCCCCALITLCLCGSLALNFGPHSHGMATNVDNALSQNLQASATRGVAASAHLAIPCSPFSTWQLVQALMLPHDQQICEFTSALC